MQAELHVCLWEHRFQKGWTQSELAIKVGVTQGYISQIETGEAVPNLFVAKRLAEALEISIEQLIREAEAQQ